ncbi:hypothetical protein ACWCRD_27530 [Streptomyces sp. NPDC002092]
MREGAVRAYSAESRNQYSQSKVRGHLVLLVTDQARNPEAFGGRPKPVGAEPDLRRTPGRQLRLR